MQFRGIFIDIRENMKFLVAARLLDHESTCITRGNIRQCTFIALMKLFLELLMLPRTHESGYATLTLGANRRDLWTEFSKAGHTSQCFVFPFTSTEEQSGSR